MSLKEEHERLGLVRSIESFEEFSSLKRRRYLLAFSFLLFFLFFIVYVSSNIGHTDNIAPNNGGPDDLSEKPSDSNANQQADDTSKPIATNHPTIPFIDSPFDQVDNIAHFHPAVNNHDTLQREISRCEFKESLPKPEQEIKQADCGSGYNFKNSSAKFKHWSVLIYGDHWTNEVLSSLGVHAHRSCPLSPKCSVIFAKSHRKNILREANVILLFQKDAEKLMHSLPSYPYTSIRGVERRVYRVIYWRDILSFPDISLTAQSKLDFEIGIHFNSALPHPSFFRTPSGYRKLIQDYIPSRDSSGFAITISNYCRSESKRDEYLDSVVSFLGVDRVHHYGACGEYELPSGPVEETYRIISGYQFFFAFESEIQSYYTTEKLLFALGLPPIPVYYGNPTPPNITITPSYIKASDFPNAKALAVYLLYTSTHPEEYRLYNTWKNNPAPFHPDYLSIMETRVPGPEELAAYVKENLPLESASFCRLCDEHYVKYASQLQSSLPIPGKWHNAAITKQFFAEEQNSE